MHVLACFSVSVPEYDVTTPIQTDHKGDYLTYDLATAHSRARREEHHLLKDVPAHFELTAFGKHHQMTVNPNNDLLAPSFFVQTFGDNDTVHTDFDLTMCHFVGKLTSQSSASHVAVSNCNGLVRSISIHSLMYPHYQIVNACSSMHVQCRPTHLCKLPS